MDEGVHGWMDGWMDGERLGGRGSVDMLNIQVG